MLTPQLASAANFSPDSRVWVYIASRPLTEQESQTAQAALDDFVQRWTAHDQALKATAEIFRNQFIILMVDETQAGASGCSIDKSVHFLEALGHQLGIDLFERMRFAWVQDDDLQYVNREELRHQVENAVVRGSTYMVNTLVENKRDLQEKWLVPFDKSWHKRLI
ncbi:MAG: ABC transporter ATPase [Bacteroidetes bacterium]|nr:MAG: ABC transporter ATPase [Bacteroidota bacterium]